MANTVSRNHPPNSFSRTFFTSRATTGGGQPLVQSMAPRTRNVLPLLAASLKMKRIFSANQCRSPGLLNLCSLKDILSDPESLGNHGAVAEMTETTLQSLGGSSANWLLRLSRIMTTPREKTAVQPSRPACDSHDIAVDYSDRPRCMFRVHQVLDDGNVD